MLWFWLLGLSALGSLTRGMGNKINTKHFKNFTTNLIFLYINVKYGHIFIFTTSKSAEWNVKQYSVFIYVPFRNDRLQ